MTVPARKTQLPCTHYISKTINYNDVGVSTGIQVGTLPNGSRVRSIDVYIETAFNAGTTNTISVGQTGSGTDYVSATAAGSAALTVTACPIAKAVNAADQAVYVSYAQSGTAATAGVATVVVTFFPAIF